VSAADVVDAYVAALPGETRRLAHAEWGITVAAESAAGWPLDVGLRIAEGLLRAQALAATADPALDPWLLLHWNRETRLVRLGSTRAGDIWVHGDLPVAGVDAEAMDRLLGLVAQAAIAVRRYAARSRSR
jgi:Putative bacterial sensory transduction regulator